MIKTQQDWRGFSLKKLNTPEFSHLWLLTYWIFYGLAFLILERFVNVEYHIVESPADSLIPFCELFIIPYYFWFVYLIGMLLYSMLWSRETFIKYMLFIIATYSVTVLIYIIYPTAQNLRPQSFERDNIFVDIVKWLYSFDTNTNVCPSLHVVGSLAVLFSAWGDRRLCKTGLRAAFLIAAVLICASTLFLKQHSVIDVAAAILLCGVFYPVIFGRMGNKLLTNIF